MPEISIIVPCYNQAQYLDECLQSVLNQTYQDWECIIVDDGSPDNTEKVVKKWIEKDSRFQYLKKENGGVSSARNSGIEKAQGKWILPLDGDDKISPLLLELASKEFEFKPNIIYCNAEFFGEKSGQVDLEDFNPTTLIFENQLLCTAFYKKEDWKKIGGYDENMHLGYEDWEFWIGLTQLKGDSLNVKKIQYSGLFYRIKKQSRNTEAVQNINNLKLRFYIFEKHKQFYFENLENYKKIALENKRLNRRIEYLEKHLGSKRVQIVNKILSIFKF